jgi:large subunit ribosomal protein L17
VIHTGEESRTVDLIEKVFVDLAKRFQSRPGGYTRIIKVGRRRGDNAPMSIIELLQESEAKAAAEPAKPTEPEKPAEPEKAAAPKAEEPKAEAAAAAAAEPVKKKPSRAKKKAEAGE